MPQSTSREPRRPHHRAFGVAALALFATVLAAGCGSRGPLDLEGSAAEDSGADAEVPDAEPVVDATPPKDTGPETGTGLVDCGLCIANKCGGAILACLTKPDCQKILTCVTQTCLAGGGGGLNPICLLTCAQSAPAGAGDAITVVTCLTQTCGPTCLDVLRGLGGLGGGGGGGGGADAGRTDAGRRDGGDGGDGGVGKLTLDDPRAAVNYLFSPWPVLACPAEQP
jgi:predicted small lipoprotein YifL